MAVAITAVEQGSHAQRAGIRPGWQLVSINGNEIIDVLDYRFYETEKELSIELLDENSNVCHISVTKGEYDSIGLEFETYLMDRQRCCRNKCIFCFIDQMPKGMRPSLYFKDDDERLSFLFGNYITLTNLSERDVERIIKMHISPVNISVHTTNPELRVQMMKNPHAGEALSIIEKLAQGGIKLNCQLVLCPGYNDGAELERSLSDLLAYGDAVQSIAAVPVGLTKCREGLPQLAGFDKQSAGEVIDIIERFGEKNLCDGGSVRVWAADEFYLLAGREIPGVSYYEDMPQIENGVGMIASLRDEFFSALDSAEADELFHSATIATGVSAYSTISALLDAAREKWHNTDWEVIPIRNDFFGSSITVTGLITGGDLIAQLRGRKLASRLLISESMLRHEGDMFLDDVTPEQVGRELGTQVVVVRNDGWELLDALLAR